MVFVYVYNIMYLKIIMKLNSFIAVPLALVYCVLTIFDVGIFNCGCTHSQQFVILNVQTTCPPCSKSTESCCAHHEEYDEEDNEDDCCPLLRQYVVVDQLNVTNSQQSHGNQSTSIALFAFPFSNVISGITEGYPLTKNHSPPQSLLKIPAIYLYGQLRL